jgi:uncharacterized membrane protein
MWGMSRSKLRKCVDNQRVVEAIQQAEHMTSGEIRVSVASFFWGDVAKVADKAFQRLHMEKTAARNGVLFFVVPSRKRFVILGDAGIHAKVGQAFWEDVAACVAARFREGDFTQGLVNGIHLVGERLAEHFPSAGADDQNELPDEVDYH